MIMNIYYVYIMTNRSGTLYIGVTSDLRRRVYEHKRKVIKGFSSRYNISRLVYFEEYGDPEEAIGREKQLKGWRRAKKLKLVEDTNEKWKEISVE
jgi:putative endonuclease